MTIVSRPESEEGPRSECRPTLYRITGTKFRLPAVTVETKGKRKVVFPLARDDLGRVWTTNEQLEPWVEEEKKSDWATARDSYAQYVDYPKIFFAALLHVSRGSNRKV